MGYRKIVNICLGLSCLFLIVSCSQPSTKAENSIDPQAGEDALQVIWGSRVLPLPVDQLGLSQGALKYVLAVYKGGGVQILDFELDRLTDIVDGNPSAITAGFDYQIGESAVALFFGVEGGVLTAYIFVPELNRVEAVPVNIPDRNQREVAGVCAGMGADGAGISLAWWYQAQPNRLHAGRVATQDLALVVETISDTNTAGELYGCDVGAHGPKGRGFDDADETKTPFGSVVLSDGYLAWADDDTAIDILDGLSLQVPESVTAIAARAGETLPTLPDGTIAIAGDYANSEGSRILFLGRMGVQAQ